MIYAKYVKVGFIWQTPTNVKTVTVTAQIVTNPQITAHFAILIHIYLMEFAAAVTLSFQCAFPVCYKAITN